MVSKHAGLDGLFWDVHSMDGWVCVMSGLAGLLASSEHHSRVLAAVVGSWLLHTAARSPPCPQRSLVLPAACNQRFSDAQQLQQWEGCRAGSCARSWRGCSSLCSATGWRGVQQQRSVLWRHSPAWFLEQHGSRRAQQECSAGGPAPGVPAPSKHAAHWWQRSGGSESSTGYTRWTSC